MICPYCLSSVQFKLETPAGSTFPIHTCPKDGERIPASYVREYNSYPPMVMSAIGFRAHGKTTYFATLFYAFRKLRLDRYWKDFFVTSLNEEALDTVERNLAMLDNGKLPDATAKNFPRPTLQRIHGIPEVRNCTLLCYDTGGECFERAGQLVQYASFVRQARSVVFLISIPSLQDPATEMFRLLETYLIGLAELGGNSKDQQLIVVYSRADELMPRFRGEWQALRDYVVDGGVEQMQDMRAYLAGMERLNRLLADFTRSEAPQFETAARKNFRTVTYSMISALGSRPTRSGSDQIVLKVTPRRLLDPLLWTIKQSSSRWPFPFGG